MNASHDGQGIAPFVPFVSETIWRNLSSSGQTPECALCDYPTANEQWQDDVLSERMALLREVASLGLRPEAAQVASPSRWSR